MTISPEAQKRYNRQQSLYEKKNRAKITAREREHNRKHWVVTTIDGKEVWLKGDKRPYPTDQRCEMCPIICLKKGSLVYHHWDNTDISKGMWVCRACHSGITVLERQADFTEKYFNLKELINNQ